MAPTIDDIAVIQSERFRERFWRNIHVPYSGCHEWTGATNHGGYGKMSVRSGLSMSTHRVGWIMEHGVLIPEGLQIDHLCFNRACARASHLDLVTPRENIRRMARVQAAKWNPPPPKPTVRKRNGKYQVRWRQYQDDRTVVERSKTFTERHGAELFITELADA